MSKVVESLKTLQADALVMYVKFHNYHWNVKGPQFYAIHEATEKMYDDLSTLYDDLAERVLQLGEKPYVTIKSAIDAARVKEETKVDFTTEEVVAGITGDFAHLLGEFRVLSDIAGEADDKGTVAFADELVAKLEKDLWMLKAVAS